MRTLPLAMFTSLISIAVCAAEPRKAEHPAEVALIIEEGSWSYRQFPTNLPLYVFDGDQDGKVSCIAGCALRWPLLKAPADSKRIGDWTVIDREDGKKQWAYKGRPVYTRFHDSIEKPTGDGIEGEWHLLVP